MQIGPVQLRGQFISNAFGQRRQVSGERTVSGTTVAIGTFRTPTKIHGVSPIVGIGGDLRPRGNFISLRPRWSGFLSETGPGIIFESLSRSKKASRCKPR